jgi:ubiquinone/menaquinone biosynthesis C-methylase UbiE
MTNCLTRQPMYENGSLSKATGDKTLRPGGFDLTDRLLTLCELSADSRIVDVGCGTGGTVEYLLDSGFAHAIGIDRSELLLQTGICRRPDLPLACAWSKSLPIASGCADAILTECSFSAMAGLDGALTEFHRVLRSGGRLALSDIYARNAEGLPALYSLPLSCGLRHAATREQLTENLQAHGFEIAVWEDHSEMLKQLVGQMILAHGSMREFWSQSEPGADPMALQSAVREAKLGYHLLVAQKR